jgi:hypothetical protein
MITRYLLFLIFLALAFSLHAQDTVPQPGFGDELIVLQVSDTFITHPVMSPTGRFVFATANHFDRQAYNEGKSIYRVMIAADFVVWDISLISAINDVYTLQPTYTLPIQDSIMGPATAFSSDEEFLALRNDTDLLIFSLPDFQQFAAFPLNAPFEKTFTREPGYLRWSHDNQWVATLDDGEIMVVNIHSGEVRRHDVEAGYGWNNIKPIENGWIVELFDPEKATAFVVCDFFVEICQSYDDKLYTHTIITVTNGDFLVTETNDTALEGRLINLWVKQNNLQYFLNAFQTPPKMGRLQAFSPSGEFLMTAINTNIWEWAIWSFPELSRISTIPPETLYPVWLPDSQHIIGVDKADYRTLQLYRVGSSEVLDHFNPDDYAELPLGYERFSINETGTHIMLNTGWQLLIVPIEYK